MTDRKKLIKALEGCLGDGACSECVYRIKDDYTALNCRIAMMRDCLEALKEQPEPPHVVTCEECTHWDKKSGLSARWCETWKAYTMRREWCSRVGRRIL